MSENLGLGKIITTKQHRDAIHIAVIPVVAGVDLHPGKFVVIEDGLAYHVGPLTESLGVVDPFLDVPIVKAGQTFWLYLNPGSITSLRHHWEHPAFPEPTLNQVMFPDSQPIANLSKEQSEAWLREFVKNSDCPDYYQLIAAALDNSDTWDGEYLHFNGSDAHGEIPAEFWDHVEAATGEKVPLEKRAKYFSCSC